MLPAHVRKWWDIANDRRQKLIVRKHAGGGLTPQQDAEYKMLQSVADYVVIFGDTVWCKKCGDILEVRDRGWFPTHACKRKSR